MSAQAEHLKGIQEDNRLEWDNESGKQFEVIFAGSRPLAGRCNGKWTKVDLEVMVARHHTGTVEVVTFGVDSGLEIGRIYIDAKRIMELSNDQLESRIEEQKEYCIRKRKDFDRAMEASKIVDEIIVQFCLARMRLSERSPLVISSQQAVGTEQEEELAPYGMEMFGLSEKSGKEPLSQMVSISIPESCNKPEDLSSVNVVFQKNSDLVGVLALKKKFAQEMESIEREERKSNIVTFGAQQFTAAGEVIVAYQPINRVHARWIRTIRHVIALNRLIKAKNRLLRSSVWRTWLIAQLPRVQQREVRTFGRFLDLYEKMWPQHRMKATSTSGNSCGGGGGGGGGGGSKGSKGRHRRYSSQPIKLPTSMQLPVTGGCGGSGKHSRSGSYMSVNSDVGSDNAPSGIHSRSSSNAVTAAAGVFSGYGTSAGAADGSSGKLFSDTHGGGEDNFSNDSDASNTIAMKGLSAKERILGLRRRSFNEMGHQYQSTVPNAAASSRPNSVQSSSSSCSSSSSSSAQQKRFHAWDSTDPVSVSAKLSSPPSRRMSADSGAGSEEDSLCFPARQVLIGSDAGSGTGKSTGTKGGSHVVSPVDSSSNHLNGMNVDSTSSRGGGMLPLSSMADAAAAMVVNMGGGGGGGGGGVVYDSPTGGGSAGMGIAELKDTYDHNNINNDSCSGGSSRVNTDIDTNSTPSPSKRPGPGIPLYRSQKPVLPNTRTTCTSSNVVVGGGGGGGGGGMHLHSNSNSSTASTRDKEARWQDLGSRTRHRVRRSLDNGDLKSLLLPPIQDSLLLHTSQQHNPWHHVAIQHHFHHGATHQGGCNDNKEEEEEDDDDVPIFWKHSHSEYQEMMAANSRHA